VSFFAFALIWFLETAGRFLPLPCRTGLRAVGDPGPDAPVFLTGNYHLTVARLRRALRGLNCWLLVADSHGINIWCAAAGGHFTDHSVVSALKTSGIEQRVSHRRVVLPQLAAAGIRARRVTERSGWQCAWGPVEAGDIPEYLRLEGNPDSRLRQVRFPWNRRLEMALAWAFPLGLLTASILLFFAPALIPSFLGWVAAASLGVFIGFPLYAGLLPQAVALRRSDRRRRRRGLLIAWGALAATLVLSAFLLFPAERSCLLAQGGFVLLLLLLLTVDLPGSTPLLGSAFHAEKHCRVVLQNSLCRGSHDCVRVCPRCCFTPRPGGVVLNRTERCIRCGACIVQCENDALCLRDATGRIISAQQVRKRKLGLSGRRNVNSGG